jgi:hypothetical protein
VIVDRKTQYGGTEALAIMAGTRGKTAREGTVIVTATLPRHEPANLGQLQRHDAEIRDKTEEVGT